MKNVTTAALICLICFSISLFSACGDSDGGTPEITVDGTIVGFLVPDAVAGARVCIHGRTDIECDTTDANGQFSLSGIPGKAKIWGHVSKQDYMSMLIPLHTGTSDTTMPELFLVTPAEADFLASTVNLTITAGQGHMLFNARSDAGASSTGVAGVSVGLSPSSGDGPFYVDEDGSIDLDLTASSTNGVVGFFNMAPGSYTLTASGSSCSPLYGWEASAGAGTLDVLIEADTITVNGQVCQ